MTQDVLSSLRYDYGALEPHISAEHLPIKLLLRSIPTRLSGDALSSPLLAPSPAIRARRDAGHAPDAVVK